MKRFLSLALALFMVLSLMPQITLGASAAEGLTVYCVAPDWENCNVYVWNSATNANAAGWPGTAMTEVEDGVWSATVDNTSYDKIIFNNGSDQTADLNMPTDENVQYNFTVGTWSTYGASVEVPETVYYLRGTMNEWGTTHPMTKNDDGTYTITISLAAGTYGYKAANADWGSAYPAGDNATLTLEEATDVTFTLDVTAGTITNNAPEVEEPEVVIDALYAVGEGSGSFLNGAKWDPAVESNKMTETSANVYEITYTDVSAGTYEFKVAANGAWTHSWGSGAAVTSGVEVDAYYNGSNSILTVAEDGSTVAIKLDRSGCTAIENAAKLTVTVTAPAAPSTESLASVQLVEVECTSQVSGYVVGNSIGLTIGDVVLKDGVYTCTITADLDSIAAHAIDNVLAEHTGYSHTAPTNMTGRETITATWNATDEKWEVTPLSFEFECTEIPPVVAKIGENEYSSVKADLDAAIEAGEGTVTIVSEDGYAATGDRVDVTKAGTYTITGGNGIMLPGIFMQSVDNVHLVIDNAYVSAGKLIAGSGSMLNSGSSITVKDSVIDAGEFSGDGNDGASWWTMWGDAVVEITNSTVGANVEKNVTGKDGITDVPYGQGYARMRFGTAGTATITGSTMVTGFFQAAGRGLINVKDSTLYVGGGLNVGYTESSGSLSWNGASAADFRTGLSATVNVTNSTVKNIGWGDGGAGTGLQVGGTNAGELNLTNSTVDFSKGFPSAIHANGVLNMTGSTLKVNTLTVEEGGKINITVADIAEGTSVKLIEQTAEDAASLEGVVTITNDLPAGTSISYADGDVTLTKQKAVATIGTTRYYSLADALNAAVDGDTVTLVWSEGDAPIVMKGVVDNGKTVTITGTATVDWTKGNLWIGREGNGNGNVIFDGANITSSVKANPAGTGIHVSGEKDSTKNDGTVHNGTLVIKNSTIELDYLIMKNTMEVDNSTLTVYGGFGISGRDASDAVGLVDATATIDIKNGSKVTVVSQNGMPLGYEGKGVLNLDNSTFECADLSIKDEEGTSFNVSGNSTLIVGKVTGDIEAADGSDITVKLLSDVTLTEVINVANKTVTIEGADKAVTITANATEAAPYDFFTAGNGGKLTLGANLNIEGSSSLLWAHDGGEIVVNGAKLTSTGTEYAAAAVYAGSKLTVTDGSIVSTGNSVISAQGAGAVVTIEDGTVETTCETGNWCAVFARGGAVAEVKGGTVTAANSYGLVAVTDGTVKVSGGTVKGVAAHENANAKAEITGGTVNGTLYTANGAAIAVSDGTFENEVPYEYCAEGFIPEANENGTYGVKTGKYVASITTDEGTTYFETLAEAVAVGGEVKVLTDVELTDDIVIENKTVSISADEEVKITTAVTDVFTVGEGGKLTLGANLNIEGSSSLLWAHDGGEIVVNGAKLTSTGTEYAAAAVYAGSKLTVTDGSIVSTGNSVISAQGAGAVVTIEGGTVETTCTTGNWCAVFARGGAVAEVKGGTVTAANSYGMVAVADGTVKVSGGTVDGVAAHENANAKAEITAGTVTGGLYTNNDAAIEVSGGSFENAVAEEYCAEGYIPTKNADNTYGVKVGKYVASVTDAEGNVTKYETLADAVTAANSGDTVTVLAKIELTEVITINKEITIQGTDLGGVGTTIESTVDDVLTVGAGGKLTLGESLAVYGYSSSVLWVKDGGEAIIDGTNLWNNSTLYCPVAVYANSKLTVKRGMVSASNNSAISVSGAGAVVTIEGGTVATACETENNGAYYCAVFARGGAVAEVKGGEVTAAKTYALVAVADGTVKVSGGTVKGVAAHENANAKAEITGGTVNYKLHAGNGATVEVSGGSFENIVPKDYCAVGYAPVTDKDENGMYTVALGYVLNVNTNAVYGTLADALAEAKKDEELRLLKTIETDDVNENMVMLSNGIDLDLNGQTLKVNYLVAFTGSNVVDGCATKGRLVVNEDINLHVNNKQMPVLLSDGYVFSAMKMGYETMDTDGEYIFKTWFKPSFGMHNATDSIAENFVDNGINDHGLRFIVRLSWINASGSFVTQEFEYTDELAQAVYGDTTLLSKFTLTVTSIASNVPIDAHVIVESDTGAKFVSQGWNYNNGTVTQLTPAN